MSPVLAACVRTRGNLYAFAVSVSSGWNPSVHVIPLSKHLLNRKSTALGDRTEPRTNIWYRVRCPPRSLEPFPTISAFRRTSCPSGTTTPWRRPRTFSRHASKERILHGRVFGDVEELRQELDWFAEVYNERWLVQKHDHKTPSQIRAEQRKKALEEGAHPR